MFINIQKVIKIIAIYSGCCTCATQPLQNKVAGRIHFTFSAKTYMYDQSAETTVLRANLACKIA